MSLRIPSKGRVFKSSLKLAKADIVSADPHQGQVRELARHDLLGPGQASIDDAHYPDRP